MIDFEWVEIPFVTLSTIDTIPRLAIAVLENTQVLAVDAFGGFYLGTLDAFDDGIVLYCGSGLIEGITRFIEIDKLTKES